MAQIPRDRTTGAGIPAQHDYHTGILYSGREALATSKDGVCQTGWHVPTSEEWRLWTNWSTTVPLHGRALKACRGWGFVPQQVLANPAYCNDMAYVDSNACQTTVFLVSADGEDSFGFTAPPNLSSPSNTTRRWVGDSGDADPGLVASLGFTRPDSLVLRKLPRDSLAGVRCMRD